MTLTTKNLGQEPLRPLAAFAHDYEQRLPDLLGMVQAGKFTTHVGPGGGHYVTPSQELDAVLVLRAENRI